ncbi:MAG: c-type cytochrome, partial [Burkholderiales bacterium]
MRIGKLVRVRTALAAAALSVAAAAGAADPAAGKAKFEPCLACHGPGSAPQGMVVPLLDAQPDNFLQWQLVYFRTETRKDPVMTPIAAGLTNSDIRNLGAYLSSLPPPALALGKDDRPDLTEAGEQLAIANRCANCHQDGFVGKDAVARVAGQREPYLLKALRDFKSGARRGGGVAAMPDAVYPLSDAGLQALAH